MTSITIVLLYFFYVLFDAISIIPRISGSALKKSGLGYSFSVMISTVKRIFVVSYPPILGLMIINGEDIISTIYACYFIGAIALLIVYGLRFHFINYFGCVIMNYSSGGSLLRSLIDFEIKSICSSGSIKLNSSGRFSYSVLWSSSWVYFIYGSSLFFVNLLGSVHKEVAPVIFQLVGLINALGTLLMSFFLDPKLARCFDEGANIMDSYNSLVLGQCLSLIFFGPLSLMVFQIIYQG